MAEKVRSILDDIARNQPETPVGTIRKKPKNKGVCCFWEQENVRRGNWTGRLEFLVSTLGFCLGLGEIWRLPYAFLINGGAAFFIPFIFFLLLVGLPLFLMEFGLGQFCSRGVLNCWGYNPIFRGIGAAMMLLSALVAIYHNALVGFALWYLIKSMAAELPWAKCLCKSSNLCSARLIPISLANCTKAHGLTAYMNNGTCYDIDGNLYGIFDLALANSKNVFRSLPANNFFENEGFMTGISKGIDDLQGIRWDLALCLLAAWIFVFLALIMGIRSMAKVAYVTTFLPLLILLLLFIIAMTQPGADVGLALLTPNFDRIKEAKAWCHAGILVFYLTGLCWGGLITLASFNRFHTDIARYSFIIPLISLIVYSLVVLTFFAFLGIVIKNYGVTLALRNLDSSVVLAFIIVPQGIAKLPVPVLWSILYFLMLVAMGIGTVMVLVLTIVVALTDSCRALRRTLFRIILTLAICIILFLLGLTMTTVGGLYMLQLMDNFVVWWSVAVLAIILVISFAIYGPLRFGRDIEIMLRKRCCCCVPWICNRYPWTFAWLIAVPIVLVVVVIICLATYTPGTLRKYSYPSWALVLGWLMTASILAIFVFVLLICCIKHRCNCKQMCCPSRYWGPALLKDRKHVTYAEGFVVDPKENQEVPEDMQYDTYDDPGDYGYDNANFNDGSNTRTNL